MAREPDARPTILVIDDEPQIRRVVRNAAGVDGARVIEAASGQEGIDAAAAQRPQLVILDLGLPDMPGAEVCRELRGFTRVPIVVLSARHSDAEKVSLLDLGADDYVTKPFSTSELQARIRAHLRRTAAPADTPVNRFEGAGAVIDLAKRSVTRDGSRIHLTPLEWDLLRVLVANAGRTLTHAYLFTQVWNRSEGDAQQYLRVHVASLRRKIESDTLHPKLIHTEPGVGYRFEVIDRA